MFFKLSNFKKNTPPLTRQVRVELHRLVLDSGYSSSMAGYVLAVALAFMIADVTPFYTLAGWLSAMTMVFVVRIAATKICKRKMVSESWSEDLACARTYISMVYLTGIVWGFGAALLFPPHSVPHQMALIFILAGLSAGAVPILSPLLEVYFFYISFPLFPLAVILFLQGQELYYWMSFLVVLFFIVLINSSKSMRDSLVTALENRFKNENLVTNLEIARTAAETASKTKNEFLANMSHEIRTPMNGILGTLQLLKESSLDHAQQDYIDMAYSSAESLLRLLNDILDFSKMEAGKLRLENVPFDIHELLAELELLIAPQMSGKTISFHVEVDDRLPARLVGDSLRLRQILINYLTNAIKFTGSGKITLRIIVVEIGDGSVRLRLEVQDTGIGISERDRKKLFSSFTQADSSMTRKYGGSGLGLAIVQRIVGLMGGTCGVESNFGEGSCFWCELPFEISGADQPPEHNMLGNDFAGGPPLPGKVLLVEDNPVNRKIALNILEKLGLSVEFATNGQEALDILPTQRFDVVVMDCQMPVMDGYTATREIRRREKQRDQKRLPIIAMTAHAMKDDRLKCLNAGMDDYLAKPVRKEDLARILGHWLARDHQF